jgi:two-component system, chemotaxis family, protein-glutamate methylesterase/glutaminase
VMHFPAYSSSAFPNILSRRGRLPVAHATSGEPLIKGRIYVAPPDHHMLLKPGRIELTRGPKENHARPAIDVLFRSAALAYGRRVIGVVLTGNLDDGTAGLRQIDSCGGLCVVQDPNDAFCSGMPESAVTNVEVDHVVPLDAVAKLLIRLVGEPASNAGQECEAAEIARTEIGAAEMDGQIMDQEHFTGKPSIYTCPDCHGTLFESEEGGVLSFRCRVGHAYSSESLASGQGEYLEQALYAALRALEESASLAKRLAQRTSNIQMGMAAKYQRRAEMALANAGVIRSLLASGNFAPPPPDADYKGETRPNADVIEIASRDTQGTGGE